MTQSSRTTDVKVPDKTFKETLEWLIQRGTKANEIYWYEGRHDPIVFIAALSQQFPDADFGLVSTSLGRRPPLLASRQLMTLDHLCNQRLHIGVADWDDFEPIALHLRNDQSGIDVRDRPTLNE